MSARRHKSFTSEATTEEPVTFDLDGEKFTCSAVIPAGVFLDMVDQLGDGDTIASAKVIGFVREVLVPDDKERFDKLIHDTTRVVPIATLGDVTMWIIEEMTGRPFEVPSPSPDTP